MVLDSVDAVFRQYATLGAMMTGTSTVARMREGDENLCSQLIEFFDHASVSMGKTKVR